MRGFNCATVSPKDCPCSGIMLFGDEAKEGGLWVFSVAYRCMGESAMSGNTITSGIVMRYLKVFHWRENDPIISWCWLCVLHPTPFHTRYRTGLRGGFRATMSQPDAHVEDTPPTRDEASMRLANGGGHDEAQVEASTPPRDPSAPSTFVALPGVVHSHIASFLHERTIRRLWTLSR